MPQSLDPVFQRDGNEAFNAQSNSSLSPCTGKELVLSDLSRMSAANRKAEGDKRDTGRDLTKRAVSKINTGTKNLTKRASVFYITERYFYKSSEAVYHNVGNEKMKLFQLWTRF
jgi:hypothetical protein